MELLISIDMIALSVPLNGFCIIALHIQCGKFSQFHYMDSIPLSPRRGPMYVVQGLVFKLYASISHWFPLLRMGVSIVYCQHSSLWVGCPRVIHISLGSCVGFKPSLVYFISNSTGVLFVFPLSALLSLLLLRGLMLSLQVMVFVLTVSTGGIEISLFWSY